MALFATVSNWSSTQKDRLAEFFRRARELYPDMLVQVDTIFVSGDLALTEWTLQAVVGPFVLALIPSRGLGQLGRTYFVNMMIFQCWGLLYAILQALMSALQITDPMQFNGSWLQAFVGSSQMIVMSVASVLPAIMVALAPSPNQLAGVRWSFAIPSG